MPLLIAVSSRMLGQSPGPAPAFEVATLKISAAHGSGVTAMSPYGTERFTVTNASADLLVQIAFGVQPYQIVGEPAWFESELYDLTAKAEEGVKLTSRELQPGLQRLLAERMKLEVHREKKHYPGFALVVAEGGPKLKEGHAANNDQGVYFPGGLHLPFTSMDWFASMLTNSVGQPVVNKTGIAGFYDVDLNYGRQRDEKAVLAAVIKALREQVGLTLEPQTVTVEMLVVDHVERVPVGK